MPARLAVAAAYEVVRSNLRGRELTGFDG